MKNRICILLAAPLSLAMYSSTSLAEEQKPIQAKLEACASIISTTQRLDCYDTLTRSLRVDVANPLETVAANELAPKPKPQPQSVKALKAPTAPVIAKPPVATTQNTAPAQTAPSVIPPDELGAERKGVGSNKNKEPESVLVKVIKCSKIAGKNKLRFHLEGGQIWNQISDKRLNYRNCDFLAYINKDFFGYKMEVKDTGKRFRVSRVK